MQNPSVSHVLRRSDQQAKERLFSLWSIGLFAVGIVLVLMVLFPKQRIFNQVAQASQVSAASTFFLENLLKAKPEDTELRLLLVHHQIELGNMHRAEQILSSLLENPDADLRGRAYLQKLRILEIHTYAFSKGSEERRQGIKAIGHHIELFVTQSPIHDPHVLTKLAELAMNAGHETVAQTIYEQLARQSVPSTHSWYAKAAELALRHGEYLKAASLYFSAQENEAGPQKHRKYYLAGLKCLQSGNLLQEAVRQAEVHLGRLKDDETTLLFLVTLGRAAGDGAFAQRYMRDLLHVTLSRSDYTHIPVGGPYVNEHGGEIFMYAPLISDTLRFAYMESWFEGPPNLHASSSFYPPSFLQRTSLENGKIRPFDDRIYQLGYAVYLENNNLSDAYILAQTAVRQVPNRIDWRKKLAKVATWTSRPSIALAQWRAIAEMNPSREAFEQILHFAPVAYDDEQVVFALLGLGKIRSLSGEERRLLSDAFERLGKPEDARIYLAHLHQQNPEKALLEHLATLSQRMGKDRQAVQYYQELEGHYGSTPTWSMQIAKSLSAQGNLRGAYAALLRAKAQVGHEDVDFWEFVAHLAWFFDDDQEAEAAYHRLWVSKEISIEAQERLILLLRTTNPDEAITISVEGWETYHQPKFLLQALTILLKEKKIAELKEIFDELVPSDEQLVAHDPQYWMIRAEVMQKLGNTGEAFRSYEQALEINHDSVETRGAWLWFLIGQKDLHRLKRYVNVWRGAIEGNSYLWGPAAAAYVVLGQPEQSLSFFVRQLQQRKNDYLWLLNYADALEASSRYAAAWQVRQHAWLVVRRVFFTQPADVVSPESLEGYIRLVNLKDPGDQLHRLLRHVKPHATSLVMKELVLSWFLSQEAFDAAKVWLWNNYARHLHEPGWANLAVALAENNWEAIDALVRHEADVLALSDKVEAANTLERHSLAQTLSVQSLTDHPDNDVMYSKYQESITSAVKQITSRVLYEERRPISSFVWKASMPVPLGRLLVKPTASVTWQKSVDDEELTGVPRVDRQFGISLGYRLSNGTIRLTGFHRKAVSNILGIGLEYEHTWNEHFSSRFTLGRNQKADDSIVLLIGGVKDFIRGQGLYYFSKRQFLSLQVEAPQFLSQSRDKVGHGLGVEGVIGHHIRKEYPDVTVQIQGTVQRYWRNNSLPGSISRLIPSTQEVTSNVAVPESFMQSGIGLSLGDSIRDIYTKGIRPFGLIGVNYNSATGLGRSVEVGLATRLLGQDRLLVYGSNIRGGFGQNATTSRINLEYQRWF